MKNSVLGGLCSSPTRTLTLVPRRAPAGNKWTLSGVLAGTGCANACVPKVNKAMASKSNLLMDSNAVIDISPGYRFELAKQLTDNVAAIGCRYRTSERSVEYFFMIDSKTIKDGGDHVFGRLQRAAPPKRHLLLAGIDRIPCGRGPLRGLLSWI